MDYVAIHNEAKEKAREAAQSYLNQYGEQIGCCGFAWVSISGRNKFINAIKKAGLAWMDRSYSGPESAGCDWSRSIFKGYDFWNPSGLPTQNIGAKEAGAYAYKKHLADYGITVTVSSRLD